MTLFHRLFVTRRIVTRIVAAAGFAGCCIYGADTITLEQAEAIAVRNHPRLAAAQTEAAAAQQAPVQAKSAFLPQATVNLTSAVANDNARIAAGALNNPIIYSRAAGGVNISQLVTDFGRTSNLVQSAKFTAAAQQSAADATRAAVLIDVDRAYFDVLRAQSVLHVAEETLKTRTTVSDQVNALAQSKLKSQLDVSFANVNVAEAKLLVNNAKNQLSSALATLSAAMGYDRPQELIVADVTTVAPLPPEPAGLITQALQQRPELAQLRAELSSSQRFANAERDLSRPTVSAMASVGDTPFGVRQIGSDWTVAGVNVSIPVFNGHLYSSRRTEAELRAKAAEQRLRDAQNTVAANVRVAFLTATNANERVGLTKQLVDDARLAFELAQSRYQLGLGSIVELNQAQLRLTEAEIAGATAVYDYEASRAALDYQLGLKR